jgi:hypothetical protein
LGAGPTIQPVRRLLLRNPDRRGQGPTWAVQLYDDDDDDDDEIVLRKVYFEHCKIHISIFKI